MRQRFMKSISFFLIFSFLLLDFTVQKAKAEMIDTGSIVTLAKQGNARARVMSFLDRQDVQQAMEQQGIAAEEAKQRVAALSDAEVMQIAQAMDQLPAGGDAFGAIIGAAVLIFIVLLITDIAGLTHVFSFVNHRR
ncbi:MAG: PA2779 family protein [Proteobacteria bacterium]|nr:PA2779 family protein [Pseudomonadota bacterium]MBU4296069.1 PA2779 family protein [Pseudomonadota bacterium]MCG2748005.1 PA2779 family protein [Desulfobulbaceae bacterium]